MLAITSINHFFFMAVKIEPNERQQQSYRHNSSTMNDRILLICWPVVLQTLTISNCIQQRKILALSNSISNNKWRRRIDDRPRWREIKHERWHKVDVLQANNAILDQSDFGWVKWNVYAYKWRLYHWYMCMVQPNSTNDSSPKLLIWSMRKKFVSVIHSLCVRRFGPNSSITLYVRVFYSHRI